MPTAISTGFRHPLGDGTLTEAWDGEGFYVPQGNPALPGYIAGGANFGDPYDPNDLSRGYHVGEDWNFEVGDDLNAPVYAASNGQIVYANAYGHGMGNVTVIRHDLPGGGAVYSLYAHLNESYINLIGTVGTAGSAILGSGPLVTIGDRIGGVGNTGPTSPHLHFEIYEGQWDRGLLEFGYSTAPRPSGWFDPTNYINTHRATISTPNSTLPVNGTLVENFGFYGDVGSAAFHYGNDFSASAGTDVFSMANGRVVFSSSASQASGNGYGYTIIIQHRDDAGNLIDRFSAYSHLQNPPLLAAGATVTAGQHVGDVGHTGGNYPDHLHLSILGGLQAAELIRTDGTLTSTTDINLIVRGYALQIGTFGTDSGTPTYEPGPPPYYGNIINPGTIFGDLRGPSNDWILPIAGDDIIDGKSGTDTVEYQESIDRIWFFREDATSTIALAVSDTGLIKGDILFNVERLADNGARNIIDIASADMQTLFVGSSSASTRYVVPTQAYQNVAVDGGGGQDTVVVWGVRSDWQVVDVSGPGYWLTSNSTPPTSGFSSSFAALAAASPYTIHITDVEKVEFSNGTFAVGDLLVGVSGPDLTVGSVGLGSLGASPGSDIVVSFDIANIGNQSTTATRGEIILSSSSDFSGTVRVLDTFSIAAFDASGGPYSSRNFTETVTLPVDLGRTNYYVGIRVDTTNSINEASESNNLASSSALAVGGGLSGDPDLSVGFTSFPSGFIGSIGGTVPVKFTISADADGSLPYTYRVYYSTDGTLGSNDIVLHEATTTRGLGYHGVHYYALDLQVPGSASNGVGYFFVQADPNNVMAEQREDNNVRSRPILISPDTPDADTLPDLFAQRVHIRNADNLEPNSTIYAGQQFNYATDFGNFSTDDAVPDVRLPDGVTVFQNALILSEDAIISSDDRVIHLDRWNAFAPGEFRTTNSSVTMTLPSDIGSGTYFVAVVTDYYNTVQEEIESNNVSLVQQIEIVNNIPVSIATVDDAISLVNVPIASGNALANDLYQLFSTPVIDRVNGSAALIGTPIILSSGTTFQLNADGSFNVDAENVLAGMSVGSSVTESVTYRAIGVNGDVSTATIEIAITRADPDTGTSGNDQINGTKWNDLLHGREGDDVVFGFAGQDTLYGDGGNDTLNGGLNVDEMSGGIGNDTYIVDSAGDIIVEVIGEGTADRVRSSVSFTMGAGDNIEFLETTDAALTSAINLTGNEIAQTITGNAGINMLNGGIDTLADTLIGGLGNDVYIVNSANDIVIETVGQGTADRVSANVSYTLRAGVNVEILNASTSSLANINLTGNEIKQTIIGNTGINMLNGGIDNLADTLAGGLGNDVYVINSANDIVIETVGQGTSDRVSASLSYVLAAGVNVEILQASTTSLANINLTGNEIAQAIIGNANANILNGGIDNVADTLAGGLGNDTYIINSANDIVIETVGQGLADRVSANVSYALRAGVNVEILNASTTSMANINLTGNEIKQTIIGNTGANVINGAGGDDTLTGGLGNDTLTGGLGADYFLFNTTPNAATNRDTITDFNIVDDTIGLDDAVFSFIGAPLLTLAANLFKNLTTGGAVDADDKILYDDTSGAIFYDFDGSGASTAIQFATLTGSPTVTASDFAVI